MSDASRGARSSRALVSVLLLAATSARAADPDPWLGRDKGAHFGVSAALASGGWALGALLSDETETRALFGGGLALGLGTAKELADLALDAGHPSWRDMAWNVAGTAVGLLLAWAVDEVVD